MQQLPQPLAALGNYRQFIGYRLVPDVNRPGKVHKKPVNIWTGHTHNPHDPAIWATFGEVAQAVAAGRVDGVGFVFTEADPFWFLDIDGALQGGKWSPLAQDLINRTAGAAIEVSQSGTGLHLFGSGPVPDHGCKNIALGLELYTAERFVALTGRQASGDVLADCGPAMLQIVADFFPPGAGQTGAGDEWTDEPCEEWNGHTDDKALLEHAYKSGSVASKLGGRASFAQLFEGDQDALATAYPDDHGARPYDESSADAALAQHLAFWTGRDCERIQRLMELSALKRDKWDREDYLPRTILNACARCQDVHQRKPVPDRPEVGQVDTAPPPSLQRAEMVTGFQFLAPPEQVEYFAGCVYVRDIHRVFVPDGQLLKPEQFKASYGGFEFSMDTENRRTTRNAWEALTESQAVRHPKVNQTMFRPDLPPGLIFDYVGKAMVNNYIPVKVARQIGDVQPFLDHLAKLLPDPRDREILLCYMAACVQHIGVKFQWCPLIQGVEGNGKTLLSRVVAEAIGMQHVTTPKATEISAKFNGWVVDNVFAYVEDVYIPEQRREVIEALKPLVTNDWQPVERKGVDVMTAYVCLNFMLNSNHRDAIRKTRNDRRFAVFYTAQQESGDLARDGMDGDYFPKLYGWLRNGGYAVVSEFLHTCHIAKELNPAGECHRAPDTTSTEAAINEGMGSVEQEIQEAIDQGLPGFAGGWVSSMALDALLKEMRAGRAIPPNKRRDLMRQLGYDWHPALAGGRVNTVVMPDNGKPKLFIRDGHIHRNLASPGEVARKYAAAQTASPVPDAGQVFIDSPGNNN